MPTPVSAAAPYCLPAQITLFHDARQVGEALKDDKTVVPEAAFPTDPKLAAAMSWGAGQIESACFVAGHYTVADLQALTGQSLVLLQGLNADLAFWKLKQRRSASSGIRMESSESDLLAFKMLDDLREGVRIFGLQDQINAGLVDTNYVDIGQLQLNNFTTEQAGRFFGQRADEARTFTSGSPAVQQ